MIEYQILRVFVSDNELYEKYNSSLKLDFIRENYPVLYRCFKCLPANSLEALEANYLANYPVLKSGDRETVHTVIESVKNTEVDSNAIINYLEAHLTRV